MPFDPITEFDQARKKTDEQNKRAFRPYTLEEIEAMKHDKPKPANYWLQKLYEPWGER